MSVLLKYIFFIACMFGRPIEGKISNQRLCGDPNCSDPVSLAKTLLRYNSDDARILSFPSNVEVTIFSKSAGTREDLWGVEIGGKRGYAPKNLLREHKVIKRNLSYLVDVEDSETNEIKTEPTPEIPPNADVAADVGSPPVPLGAVSAESIPPDTTPLPNEIRRPYEVHDGTTFFITPSGNDEPPSPPPIQASMTDSSIKPSAVDTPPVQVDEPNASMLLPSPATSSNEVEPLQDPVPEEQEGSAIYNYISSFLPGDSGSGSKESVSEGSEEYEEDEDYDDEEESSEEDEALNQKVDDKLTGSEEVLASNSVGSDEAQGRNPIVSEEIQFSEEVPDSKLLVSEEGPDSTPIVSDEVSDNNPIVSEEVTYSNPIVSDEVPDSNLTAREPEVKAQVVENITSDDSENHSVGDNSVSQMEAQVFENSENKVETKVSEPSEFSGENVDVNKVVNKDIVSIVGQEALNSAQDKAQAIGSSEMQQEAKSVEDENNLEIAKELGNESVSSSIEVEASSHQVEVVPQDVNIVNTDETLPPLPPVDLLSNSNSESPDFDQTHGVDKNVSNNSKPELVSAGSDENSVNAGETVVDSTERLPETSGGGMEINPEPPVRSIFDLISNRDSASEEIVVTEVPITTDSSVEEVLNHEQIDQSIATPEQTTEIPEQTPQANEINSDPNSTTEKTTLLADEELVTSLENYDTIDNSSVLPEETSKSEVNNLENKESSEDVESGAGFFSSLTDLLYSIPSVFTSSPSPPNPIEDLHIDETEPRVDQTVETDVVPEPDKPTDTLSGWLARSTAAPSDCTDETVSDTADETYSILPSLSKVVDDISAMQDIENSGPAMSLIITAVTVLLFTLGYYFIEKSRRDSSFIAKINNLERSLFISSKECQLVKDDLETTKGMLTKEHTSLASNETLTDELHAELEELRLAAISYEEQINSLQVELDAATDTGLEVNRMLSEVLEQNGASSTLLEGFDTLQNQLTIQQRKLVNMSEQLKSKTDETESLHAKLLSTEEHCAALENEFDALNKSFNEMMSEKLVESAAREGEIKDLLTELSKARKKIAIEEDGTLRRQRFFEERIEGLEDQLRQKGIELDTLKEMWAKVTVLESGEGGMISVCDLQEILDVTTMKKDLALAAVERDNLYDQLQEVRGAHALLTDHSFLIDAELSQMRVDRAVAESNEAAAVHKLEVLTKYFEDKEASLQSELDQTRAVMMNSSGQQVSSEEAIKLVSEQNKLLEEQNKALRQEVVEQECLRKEQVRSAEAKFNEAWLSVKQLDRKLEEARQEAAMLRKRLTAAEGAQLAGDQSNGESRLAGDLNGDLPTSPLHMAHVDLPIFPPFVSPHLGGGIPFMPPPTYPQDRRPPPLGCMSSPPLLPPPPPQHFARHYDRQQHSPDRHSPDRPAFRGGRQAGFRPLPPTANKSKGSGAGSSHSSESLEQFNNQQA